MNILGTTSNCANLITITEEYLKHYIFVASHLLYILEWELLTIVSQISDFYGLNKSSGFYASLMLIYGIPQPNGALKHCKIAISL